MWRGSHYILQSSIFWLTLLRAIFLTRQILDRVSFYSIDWSSLEAELWSSPLSVCFWRRCQGQMGAITPAPALTRLPHTPSLLSGIISHLEDNEVGKKYPNVSRDARSQCWQKRENLIWFWFWGDGMGLDLETRANNVLASDTDSLIKVKGPMFSKFKDI